jgi:glycosyltransferase involved in cell wall biosynthesis
VKVLHLPFCYYPDPPGGTEIYVEALARHQRESGMEPAIAAPASENAEYSHEGVPVHRYRVSSRLGLREQYGDGDPVAAEGFAAILQRVRPDVVHLHAFTSGVSLQIVRAAKSRGIPVVFTYHTPTVTCGRGTLLEWGAEVCDGVMDARRCARCSLHAKGLPKPASWLAASLPPVLGATLNNAGLLGSVWTALKMTELIERRVAAVRGLFTEVDRIVAVCGWVRELLIHNGVPGRKITLCRQGLAPFEAAKNVARPEPGSGVLKIAFFGRLDTTKGIDTVIEAMRLEPELPATLDIFAVAQSEAAKALRAELVAKIGGDSRIRFRQPVTPRGVVERLGEYDALAVPSRCLETGPLVAYEAFAAGTPVIGSNLGGIAELVEHERNGLLVEPNSPRAWAAAFRRLAEDGELKVRLRRGIREVRTMDDAAREMQPVYELALEAVVR